MLNSKSFNSVIHELENHDGEFIAVLDKIIKFAVNKFKSTEELREEIVEYDDIYQIILTDINFNFWFSISNGSIIYKKGINRSASFRIMYTKDILVKILKREMDGTDAFMKALIKADGDLSQGLRFIKLFRLFLKYLNNGFKKENI
ncbi:MAG: SCP2 sterol-binding domain-containing protein [Candidatus Lokiarchaeota archaeon]|nr:SCP2 sterol-binding domain-containing protein [Candidatus Lokiarchaeota archaeon]